jgi:hypothetical protein
MTGTCYSLVLYYQYLRIRYAVQNDWRYGDDALHGIGEIVNITKPDQLHGINSRFNSVF